MTREISYDPEGTENQEGVGNTVSHFPSVWISSQSKDTFVFVCGDSHHYLLKVLEVHDMESSCCVVHMLK